MPIPSFIDPTRIPRHIAIIMDGNGRWARAQGAARIFGHNHGVNAVRTVTERCAEMGVEYLTLYAFSTENWKRPADEVSALMELPLRWISERVDMMSVRGSKWTCPWLEWSCGGCKCADRVAGWDFYLP